MYMHGCFCLFTSDNSRPAYASLLSMCYDSSFGGMVCHFLSSVHRTGVITEARPRLFYRTSFEGRTDDCTLLLSPCSVFVFFPPLFSSLFLPPSLPPFFSSSLCDWHAHVPSLSLISHSCVLFSLPITGWNKEGNSGKRTVGITIDFFNHSPISLSTDRLCSCQTDWKDIYF